MLFNYRLYSSPYRNTRTKQFSSHSPRPDLQLAFSNCTPPLTAISKPPTPTEPNGSHKLPPLCNVLGSKSHRHHCINSQLEARTYYLTYEECVSEAQIRHTWTWYIVLRAQEAHRALLVVNS